MFGTGLHDLVIDWGSFYANHAAVRVAVLFAHVGGLVTAAGAAITADRGILRAVRMDRRTRAAQLDAVESTHRVVLTGLLFIAISGPLLFASDVDAFLYSRLFWTKMTLVALLIINGAVLTAAQRRAASGNSDAWPTLQLTAIASIALWSIITLCGVALANIG
jgi:hypothetical protein